MKRRKTLTSDTKVVRSYAIILDGGSGDWTYRSGCVITPEGIVFVYTDEKFTSLRAVADGREYVCQIEPALTRRGIVRAARQFAAEVQDGMW